MSDGDKALLTREICRLLPYSTYLDWGGNPVLLCGYGHGRAEVLSSPVSSISHAPLITELRLALYPLNKMSGKKKEELWDYLGWARKIVVPPGFKETFQGHYDLEKFTPQFLVDDKICTWLDYNHYDRYDLIGKGIAVDASVAFDKDPYENGWYYHDLRDFEL